MGWTNWMNLAQNDLGWSAEQKWKFGGFRLGEIDDASSKLGKPSTQSAFCFVGQCDLNLVVTVRSWDCSKHGAEGTPLTDPLHPPEGLRWAGKDPPTTVHDLNLVPPALKRHANLCHTCHLLPILQPSAMIRHQSQAVFEVDALSATNPAGWTACVFFSVYEGTYLRRYLHVDWVNSRPNCQIDAQNGGWGLRSSKWTTDGKTWFFPVYLRSLDDIWKGRRWAMIGSVWVCTTPRSKWLPFLWILQARSFLSATIPKGSLLPVVCLFALVAILKGLCFPALDFS
jgi:hypothetical protein